MNRPASAVGGLLLTAALLLPAGLAAAPATAGQGVPLALDRGSAISAAALDQGAADLYLLRNPDARLMTGGNIFLSAEYQLLGLEGAWFINRMFSLGLGLPLIARDDTLASASWGFGNPWASFSLRLGDPEQGVRSVTTLYAVAPVGTDKVASDALSLLLSETALLRRGRLQFTGDVGYHLKLLSDTDWRDTLLVRVGGDFEADWNVWIGGAVAARLWLDEPVAQLDVEAGLTWSTRSLEVFVRAALPLNHRSDAAGTADYPQNLGLRLGARWFFDL